MEFIQQKNGTLHWFHCRNSRSNQTLQSKHQQLIGYRQALSDIINDFESQAVSDAVDSIAPKQKAKKEEE